MRIAYVITRADAVGGASIHVRDLAQAMIGRGHEALVLVGGHGAVTDQLDRARVPFRPLRFLQRSLHPLRDLRAYGELKAVLREVRPDLVSVHTAKAGWIGRAASAHLGIPVVYTPHGLAIDDRISPAHGVIFGLAERAAAKWASGIICVCEYERRLALSKRAASPGKLFVVYNGVHDVGPQLRADPEASPPRIVSVARLEAPKDHQTLLGALAALRALPWRLDLVGEGPLETEIRRAAGGYGLDDRIHFVGYQADPAATLARGQIFVLSSRSEAFPRSILEALRAGLPVVASDVGGVNEAVTHGANGLLCPPGDWRALSAALAELLGNPSRRRQLGAAARATYESRFRFEQVVEETLAAYNIILGAVVGSGRHS